MEDESPKDVLVDIDLDGKILNGKEITLIGNEIEFSVSLMRVPHVMDTECLFVIDDARYCLQGKEYDPEDTVKCIITGAQGPVYSEGPPETIRVNNSLFERCATESAEPSAEESDAFLDSEQAPNNDFLSSELSSEPAPDTTSEPTPEPAPEPAPEPPPEPVPEQTPDPAFELETDHEDVNSEISDEQPQQTEDPVEEPPEEGSKQAQEETSGLEQELEEAKQAMQSLEAQLEEKDEAFAENRNNFETRIKEQEETIAAHDVSMEEKESEIAQHKEKLGEAEENISNLENELAEANSKDREYKEKAEKAQEICEKIQADLEDVKAQKDDLSNKMESIENEMEELANKNIELEQQLQPLLENVKTLTAEKEEAEIKFNELEEKYKQEIEKDEERVRKSTKELHDAINKLTQFDLMAMELLDAGQDVSFEDKLSKVKSFIIDRTNLKQIFTSLKGEGRISEDEMPDEALPEDQLDLKKAAIYVMINIFQNEAGNLDRAEEIIGTILNNFQSIDPFELELPEKDIKILGEFLIRELENSPQADCADYGAFISLMIEQQIRPLLSELPEPIDRTRKLEELESCYDKYTPKEI